MINRGASASFKLQTNSKGANRMAFNFHAITTKHGYKLDEIASVLQKEIRRGKEKEAMHWALELVESGYARYCFKRLKITAAEDIGFADPFSIVLVKELHDAWEV